MNDDIYLKIEQYLGGTMSAEEQELFESEIKNNPDLAKEVRLASQIIHHQQGGFEDTFVPSNSYTSDIRKFLKSEEATRIKERLNEAKETYAVQNSVHKKRKFPYWAAASIAILVLCSLGIYFSSQTTPSDLYVAYYSESDLPSVMQRDDTMNTLENGVESFKEGDYQTALSLITEYQNSSNEDATSAYLYAGMSYLELNKYQDAISQFEALSQSNLLDASKGDWFKALVYLKIDEKDNAKAVLAKIAASPSMFKHKEALEILEKLE